MQQAAVAPRRKLTMSEISQNVWVSFLLTCAKHGGIPEALCSGDLIVEVGL